MLALILTLACAEAPELVADPVRLEWGEVDFHTDECRDCACDDHCDPKVLQLRNAGETTVTVSMPEGFDSDHLCMAGYTDSPGAELGTLQPGFAFDLLFSICDYQGGERDSEVAGNLYFDFTDGERLIVPWTFTPVRNQDAIDSGI